MAIIADWQLPISDWCAAIGYLKFEVQEGLGQRE
jgi:hypothetical protein